MCKHRNNIICILRMALSAKMRWRLLHGGKNPQYGEFQWLGNAKCANKQINLSPNQKMYESAESGVWRVALGVWGGPIWQHAVSIMENHLQTNKGYTKKYRDLYIIQGDAHILFGNVDKRNLPKKFKPLPYIFMLYIWRFTFHKYFRTDWLNCIFNF